MCIQNQTIENDAFEKYKEQYVVQGFKQNEGLVFSRYIGTKNTPESIRILLSLPAKENLVLRQIAVKSAYLHLKFEEKVSL